MNTTPESYFDIVPWEVLANINHSFNMCERKRNFLRYIGSLLYFEISVPAAFQNYKLAGKRLGFSEQAISYWDVHIKEDLRHGQWMLNEVVLPLIAAIKIQLGKSSGDTTNNVTSAPAPAKPSPTLSSKPRRSSLGTS